MMIGRPFSPALWGSAGKVSFFVSLLLAQLMVLVKPEIVDLGVNMIIDANSDEVHFVRGFLQAPASIDLSHVKFITGEDIMFGIDDEDFDLEYDLETITGSSTQTSEPTEPEVATENTESSAQTSEPTEPEVATENKDSVKDEDNTDGEGIQDNVEEETSTEQEEEPTDVAIPPENEDNESGQVDNEDADSENIPEAPEPAGEVNNEEEPTIETPTEEEKEDESPAETAPKSESNNNEDGGDVVEEDTSNVEEDQNQQQPETTQTEVEDEVAEEVNVDTPATPSDEGSDAGNAESDTESQEKQPEEDTTPVTPSDTEDSVNDEDEESTPVPPAEDNGGGRSLANTVTDQIFEIIVFLAPPDCKRDRNGECDWVTLGVGAYDDEMVGEMSYCCSQDAADRNICSASSVGTMMIDHSIFEGDHRQIQVPSDPLTDFEMDDPLFEIKKSGDYVMVIANCNDDGLGIITLGEMEWKSKGGYLVSGLIIHAQKFMFTSN